MELNEAIELVKRAIKNNATNDENHIDLTLIPASELSKYQKALALIRLSINEGKISNDEFKSRAHL
jgi:hypothetical protein